MTTKIEPLDMETMQDMGATEFAKHFEDKESFKKAWVDRISELLNVDDKNKVASIFENNYMNSDVSLTNTVRGKTYEIDSMSFNHKAFDTPYCLIENGIIFVNQEEELPPAVEGEMQLYDARREIKDLGNYYLTDGNDPMLGRLYDLQQSMIKIIMNY